MRIRSGLMAALAALMLLVDPPHAKAVVAGVAGEGALSRATVMVLSSKGGVCSAVVVARDVVLTAAHCVTGAAEHRVHFRAPDGNPVLVQPVGTAVHPAYDPKAVERRRRSVDLALLRLPEPLPARFETASLSPAPPARDASVTVGGYGMLREGDLRSTGTFRTADLRVVEPFGVSQILVWADGLGTAGACNGDSGGPIAQGASIIAVISWSTGPKGRGCGAYTQGILLGPQRAWIDRTLAGWMRDAQWYEGARARPLEMLHP